LLLGWQETQRYLLRDPQFLMAMPRDLGEESPDLEIQGVKNAARAQVAAPFTSDYGRSLYLVPIRERRLQLLANPWIAEATVTRIWPNRLRVKVVERVPVAWIQEPGENRASRPALIDGEGNILHVQQAGDFKLPVLGGVTPDQTEQERKLRVHRFVKLLEDAGDLAERISEVDATDAGNLKVMQDESGRVVTLYLGDRQYKRRLEKFRVSYPEIQKRAPESSVFDLRIEGSILSVPQGTGQAEQVIRVEVPRGV
jgi:cell division protein FtsQ